MIASATSVKGSLFCGADDTRIDGRLEGSIACEATVTVSEGAHVAGDVDAKIVVVGGVVEGTVIAHERLHMLATGRVHGDAKYGTLQVDRGGVVKGRTMTLTGMPPDDTLEFGPAAGDRVTADYPSAVAATGTTEPLAEPRSGAPEDGTEPDVAAVPDD